VNDLGPHRGHNPPIVGRALRGDSLLAWLRGHGLPMHELSNRVIELNDLLGPEADALVGRMWELSS
jgi:hypothetical protein